jgi:tetratricopeptide (TPR) repeat protein
LIPILAGLGRDQDVEIAAHTVTGVFDRTGCLEKAATEYFRIGRSDVATKFDREALFVAASSATGEPQLQSQHDSALHNLALARARNGDIQGALDAIAKLGDDAKKREVTSYIVRNAIDGGYGPVVGPAIEALGQEAQKARDAGLLLQAANGWYEVGNEEEARRSLDEAMRLVRESQASFQANDIGLAAELMWRIDGKGDAKAMLPIVDKLGVIDPNAIDHVVEIMKPISPAVAVQLAGRQTEVERQIDELANIGIAIAEGAK